MVMRAQSQSQKSQPTAQQTTLTLETSRMQTVLGAQAMTTVVPMTTAQDAMPSEKTVKGMQLKCLPRPTANSFSTTLHHTDTPMAASQDLSSLESTQFTTLSQGNPNQRPKTPLKTRTEMRIRTRTRQTLTNKTIVTIVQIMRITKIMMAATRKATECRPKNNKTMVKIMSRLKQVQAFIVTFSRDGCASISESVL